MAKQEIDIGVEGNDGTGDSIRESFRKVNENFNEIYAVFGESGTINFTTLSDTPDNLGGANKIPRVNSAVTALEFVDIVSDRALGADTDSITVTHGPGQQIVLSTTFRQVSQDLSPTLGGPLDARKETVDGQGNILPVSIALGPNAISEDAVNEFNRTHPTPQVTIDDLVITKGYADNRYIAGDLPIRIDDEPNDALEYTLTITDYNNGNIVVPNHNFDRTINGTPYVFDAEDDDPSNLVTGQTYFLRYASANELSVHDTREDAIVQDQASAEENKRNITGNIAADDIHTMTDAGFDSNLEGFFLSNEAMPRKSVVRRQGDTMEGPLILNDSPGELAGLTNVPEELQAATKFYVDNTSYSAANNLFVSTQGDDSMAGVPAGREGTSFSYAYRTINAAAQRAEEMQRAAENEPGPYMQTITINNGASNALVVNQGSSAATGIVNSRFDQARTLIELNREFIIREVTAYLAFEFPDFAYNVETCERDLGLILDAIAFDINKSPSDSQNNANSLTRRAAERYYANASGRIAITRQYDETVGAIQKAKDIVSACLVNRPLNQTAITSITQDVIAKITTSVPHGLITNNIIVVKNVSGMTELNDNFYYVKRISNTELELYTDQTLEIPVNSTEFDAASGGVIGQVYQTDNKQFVATGLGADAATPAINGIEEKFDLVVNILSNGINAGATTIFGNTYYILVTTGDGASTDQAVNANRDIIPGKIIVGKISGAQGRVVNYYASDNAANPETSGTFDVIEVHLLKPIEFIANEDLEYGNFVNRKQITIFIESGQYEEDYPIKVANNVSLKGDEFRRVIIRPKDRISQSPWADTYIYRDQYFDGLTLNTRGARFYNQTGDLQGHFGYHYLSDPEKEINTGIRAINAGGFTTAAEILKENKAFIQEEIINYINQNSADLLYDKAQFGIDLEDIITGITYDIVLGTTYNQTYYGLRFQRDKSIYKSQQLKEMWVVGLEEAKSIVAGLAAVSASSTALARANAAFDEIIDIIENGVMDTDTASNSIIFGSVATTTANAENARAQLQSNREFIAQEALAYIKQISPTKYIDEDIRIRDYRNLVDALTYDLLYGGFFATVEFTKGLFFDENDTLRLEVTTQQETLDTLDRLREVFEKVMLEQGVVVTQGNTEVQDTTGTPATSTEVGLLNAKIDEIYKNIENGNTLDLGTATPPSLVGLNQILLDAKAAIDGTYPTIETNVISTIDASPEALYTYNADKCRRDVGLIVDALVDDLEKGGDEFSTEVQGQYYDSYVLQYNNGGFGGQENVTKGAIEYIYDIADRLFDGAYNSNLLWQDPSDSDYIAPDFKYGTAEVGTDDIVEDLINKIVFVFRRDYNPPKRNDEMDVFLMNDATILRNMTCQGHGGFLCVLDPDGQILTKSPYIQTGSSFSKSINSKIFAGGMFVDAYAGNIPVSIPETIVPAEGEPAEDGKIDNFTLWIQSEPGQGLFVRPPQLPCPFYVEGRRYQVNAISNYNQGSGFAKIYLDPGSNEGVGYDESQFNEKIVTLSSAHSVALGELVTQANTNSFGTVAEIKSPTVIVLKDIVGTISSDSSDTLSGSITGAYNAYPLSLAGLKARPLYLQTAGNRSMLGNDFTQINDLGYGLVTNNGAFSEMVSMFTYYCQAAYYAKNGSEIRSLNGSNGYGKFGLVSEGADPNEIPDQVVLMNGMTWPVKSFTWNDGENDSNIETATSIFVYDAEYPPMPNSIVEIDHGGNIGILRYRIAAVSVADIGEATPPSDGVYNNTVYRLQITGKADGENGDFFANLQGTITNGSYINYRSSETFQFEAIRDKTRLVNRPSTAINFDESDDVTYRSITFSGADNYGNNLAEDEIQTTFNIPYDAIEIQVDFANAGSGNGSAAGDTTIAVSLTGDAEGVNQLDPEEIPRLTRDIAGRQPGEPSYTGGMIFTHWGRTHQIIDFNDNGDGTGELTIRSTPIHDITAGGTGLAQGVQEDETLYAVLPDNATSEITISISLCRATGHDFTQIGTGSFNDSNYPNVILGDPVGGLQGSLAEFYSDEPDATSAQVWERRKGRVFWMSTDQFGFFRVGQFFSIDQAQGSIRFSGDIGITNANELGFRKGVTVDEFSIDDTMADNSDTAVPVEKAIVGYINKRLGRTKDDNAAGGRIGPGFMPLSGNGEMEGNLNIGGNRVVNVAEPTASTDAATKNYIDTQLTENDNYDKLRETAKNDPAAADIVVYTGLRKVYTSIPADAGAGSNIFESGDEIQNSGETVTATIRDIDTTNDEIIGSSQPDNLVYIITYELDIGSPDFTEGETIEGTGLKSQVSASIFRGPFDELAPARNSEDSVLEYSFTRTQGILEDGSADPIAEFDFQIKNGSIVNADVGSSAAIQQSKLLMNRATPRENSNGLYGSNDDTGQGNRGLAAFDGEHFTHEIRLTLSSIASAAEGDILIQGDNRGEVAQTFINNSQAVIRTSDTWVASGEDIAKAEIVDGVERAATSLGVSVAAVAPSGFIGLKDRSIGINRLQQIQAKNVFGRSEREDDVGIVTGDAEAVEFDTVVNQGLGLEDKDFNARNITSISGQRLRFNSKVSVTNGETLSQGDNISGTVQGTVDNENIVYVINVEDGDGDPATFAQGSVDGNNPIRTVGTVAEVAGTFSLIGSALVRQEDGVYGTTTISTVSANDSIARRSTNGSLQATSFIVGGNSANVVLSVTGNTLNFKTPGQGVILTASGQQKPTILTGGNIVVGDIASTSADESTLKSSSTWGTVGGAENDPSTTETSAIASRWMYTSFIEALSEKDGSSTGIALGAGNSLPSDATDTIILVTDGAEQLVVNDETSAFSTAITATGDISTNGDINITQGGDIDVKKANGSDQAFLVDGSTGNTTVAGTLASTGALSTGGALTVTTSATFGGGYGSSGATIGSAGNISTDGDGTFEGNLTVNGNTNLGDAISDELAITARVTTDIVPIDTGNRNLGSNSNRWGNVWGTTFSGTATTAKYADLAENYLADAHYEPGTVVVMGGNAEVTTTNVKGDHRVAGIVTTNPAHLMNSELEGEFVTGVALIGRVPCKVLGRVRKGDILVTSAIPGYACVNNTPQIGTIIGKAIADKSDDAKGVIEVLVGKS